MKLHAITTSLLVAGLSLGLAGSPHAQSFGSVSSLPPPKPPATTVTPVGAGTAAATATTAPPGAAGPVAATAPVSKPWEPAPFFSAPKIPATPDRPVNVPAQPAGAGASVAPRPATSTAAFSSVSPGTGAAVDVSGSGPSIGPHDFGGTSAFEVAERIVVEKAKRRLMLLRGLDVIASYPVKLGLNPFGHKQREGDFRTPEGTYFLSRRNPRSEFFLSLEVSYPSEADRARARAAGVKPGGLIMIHGQPNIPRKSPDFYANNDWTDGCIAVSNADMVDIWLRTRLGTPIEIRP